MIVIASLFPASHSGAPEGRTMVRNCAPENLEIPGLVLRTIPE